MTRTHMAVLTVRPITVSLSFVFAFRVRFCHLLPPLFAFVVLGLASTVLIQETGQKERF